MVSLVKQEFYRAYLKIQCTAPNGEIGTFLYFGHLGADPKYDKLVSPVMPDLVALYDWMAKNGWKQKMDKKGNPADRQFYPLGVYERPMPPAPPSRWLVEVAKDNGKYKPRYSFPADEEGHRNYNQAVMYYNGINIGNGYRKRLKDAKTGKILAKQFS